MLRVDGQSARTLRACYSLPTMSLANNPQISAILADFTTPNPLVTFRKEDIAFTYGSTWKQRYFTKRGDDDCTGIIGR
jgi:hypothetical protein